MCVGAYVYMLYGVCVCVCLSVCLFVCACPSVLYVCLVVFVRLFLLLCVHQRAHEHEHSRVHAAFHTCTQPVCKPQGWLGRGCSPFSGRGSAMVRWRVACRRNKRVRPHVQLNMAVAPAMRTRERGDKESAQAYWLLWRCRWWAKTRN